MGEFAWAPIGAEQTSTGYEIALKNAGTGEYTIWITDSSGNVTYGNARRRLRYQHCTLKIYETSFHQDLNGDNVIGVPTPGTIESAGSTSLVQTGNNYFLNPVAGGTGPCAQIWWSACHGG